MRSMKWLPLIGAMGFLTVAHAQSGVDVLGFQQVDWFGPTGSLDFQDSQWGRMTFSYTPTGVQQYMTVYFSASANGVGTALVENLPLVTSGGGPVTEGVDIDLSQLGIGPHQDWSQAHYSVAITTAPTPSNFAPTTSSAAVANFARQATDHPEESTVGGPLDPGAPTGIMGGIAAVLQAINYRAMNGVQEGTNQCFAGATARSIDWLNTTYGPNLGFNINRTPQQIYDDLRARGASQPNADGSKARERWIKVKNDYIKEKSGFKLYTKAWDAGGNLDPIDGVSEASGDFLEWLSGELKKGEDVEVTYNYPGSAHIVTIVGYYEQGGKKFALYRDDERQNDPNKGDGVGGNEFPSIKRAEITFSDGAYRFGGDRNKITWALSESPVPEPATLIALGAGLAALAARRKRR